MDILIRDMQYDPVPESIALRVAELTARRIGFEADELSLVFVDDDCIHGINRDFRNSDKPTDVISFEAECDGDQTSGEIIISIQTAQRQALAAGHSLETEIAWLIAHGVLHVAGMDDETEEQLAEMIELQREVMGQIGMEPAG